MRIKVSTLLSLEYTGLHEHMRERDPIMREY
jgi:hypothetical protein